MLRRYGIPVPADDARRLVATLTADGGDIALSASALVTRGLDHKLAGIALPILEREAILAVLEEPEGPLAELRGRLLPMHGNGAAASPARRFFPAPPA